MERAIGMNGKSAPNLSNTFPTINLSASSSEGFYRSEPSLNSLLGRDGVGAHSQRLARLRSLETLRCFTYLAGMLGFPRLNGQYLLALKRLELLTS